MTSPLKNKLWAAFAGAGLLLLLASPGLDETVGQWARAWGGTDWGKAWAGAAYYAGLGMVQTGVMLVFMLAAWRLGRREMTFAGLMGAAAVLLSGILTQILKHLLGRPRPRLGLPLWHFAGPTWNADFHSFPSGHAATSFALAAVLAACFPRAAWLFYLLAALDAAGRVVGGSHYLSDILGGAILGLMVGFPLVEMIRHRKVKTA